MHGAGTGAGYDGVQRKTEVLRRVLVRHAQNTTAGNLGGGGRAWSCHHGRCGAASRAERRVVVVDGFIATSAVF